MKTTVALIACLAGTVYAAAQQPRFDGKTLWRHVEVLAADDMEGRATGSAGLERAQAYVVEQLRKLGIAPAGVNGYVQRVEFVRPVVVEKQSSAVLVRNGQALPLRIGKDAAFTTFVDLAPEFEAPLFFLGYGIRIPEKNYDDFAGVDLKGRVAVTMPGVSEGIDRPLAAYHLEMSERWKRFREAGAVGWIEIAARRANWSFLRGAMTPMRLAGNEFDEAQGRRLHMVFNPAHADKLFEGTGYTTEGLFAIGADFKPLPRFPLPVSLRTTTRVLKEPVKSANIVAKLEGSDPNLRNEYVVLSAHLDHQGIGSPVNGDRIYNGAIDNASGVAALLDIAAQLKIDKTQLKRSVLFAFVTAEEGSVFGGSKYFVAHPPVDRKSIVANINIDGIQAVVPLNAMLVLGADESDLGDAARRVGASQGIAMDVDLEPQSNRFVCCSDQRSFALAGIPAVKLNVGFPGELNAAQQAWRRERYHTPFDDPAQPINFETIARYEEFARALLLEVANNPRRPEWKPNSLYRRYAK